MARLLRLAFLLVLPAIAGQAAALDQDRWVEFDYENETITYDLTTVQMIDPGRFTITSRVIDHPDVMRLKLAVLTTLRPFCAQPDGQYAAPEELFMLGKPDMPIKKIDVKTQPPRLGAKKFKDVAWWLPYRRLAIGTQEEMSFFDCEGPAVESADAEYLELRSFIVNGMPRKELYDCRHGVVGGFLHSDDPPSKAISGTVMRGAFLQAYTRLCPTVVGGVPYIPP